jgi:valyl-tRNA synthetase
MKSLPKNYEHQAREAHWQKHWVEAGTYHYAGDQPRERTFVIDTPPPTVSGILHMGHIFSYTQADFIARYQRMSGKDVFYPMGFDDNGLPTERLVEKEKGIKGSAMPRAQFIEECRSVVLDAENEFRRLFKSTALSVDWRQEYQTISDDVRQLSQASFLDLLKSGNAYRDFRPTYWDWVDQTAIAQAEIENKEMPGTMNEIEFTLEDGSPLLIMTTRPELLGACVAVMYHPEDPNASTYADKHAITPLFGVKVPMIADEAVEREKGTGLVMCCTFGDDTDKEWQRKHELPRRTILGTDGRITVITGLLAAGNIGFLAGANGKTDTADLTKDNCVDIKKAVSIYQQILGLKPKQANAKIIELLQAEGKLLKQTPMTHTVKCAERSGTPIEIIPTYQWFVRIVDKKAELLEKGAQVQWHPDYMRIRLNQWIEGLKEDWCISRQRFFGIPFPVWYSKRAGEEGKLLFADYDQLPIDPQIGLPKGYTRDEVQADTDVLDTWATSSISPQLNSHGINANFMADEARHRALFPADLRPQAHEIIRTWAFYTIAKAHLHENTIPWHNIMISGWCLASDKTKMSKSKGNVVTPVALIEEKGTDSVRYWASTSRLATDTAFSEDLLKIGKKLVGKLWNASQFVAINFEKLDGKPTTAAQDAASGRITEALDLWALTRLHHAVTKATASFEKFEYCDARVAIEDFFWNDFCDNYLELVKARAYGEGIAPAQQQSALYALYHCLEAILRLFAPFVPHITEELYSHLFDDRYEAKGSVHARGMWPAATDYPVCEASERAGIAAVDVLNVIRKAKSEANVSIKYPVAEVLVASLDAGASWADLTRVLADVKAAGNAAHISESQDIDQPFRTERGWFAVRVTLLPVEEHKLDEQQAAKGTTTPRNPDQAAHEKLEPEKMLHGVGSPDLSKHTVKVQVNRLPDSLERQK